MGILLGNLAYCLQLDLIMVLREGPAIFDMVELTFDGESLDMAASHAWARETSGPAAGGAAGADGGEILQVAHTVDVFSRYGVIFLLFLVGLDTSIVEMRRVGGSRHPRRDHRGVAAVPAGLHGQRC